MKGIAFLHRLLVSIVMAVLCSSLLPGQAACSQTRVLDGDVFREYFLKTVRHNVPDGVEEVQVEKFSSRELTSNWECKRSRRSSIVLPGANTTLVLTVFRITLLLS